MQATKHITIPSRIFGWINNSTGGVSILESMGLVVVMGRAKARGRPMRKLRSAQHKNVQVAHRPYCAVFCTLQP